MINLIVATSKNNQIGIDNKLPWHIPEDLKYFKEKTKHHTIVMGRKTYESIGRPLPDRTNVVLTRDVNFTAEGVIICHTFEEALKLCQNQNEVYIIGGGEIYHAFLPFADCLFITLVDKLIEGDTSFPEYKNSFTMTSRSKGNTQTDDGCSFEFTIWDRTTPKPS
ncbi:MAG: Dihydrofolate reductase [Clostridia bacterium]|jgi:dihydrofolate reductase|nr:Dihydrofolate reductase [Clostridia bacterium]